MATVLGLLAVVVLILVNGYFVAAEFAYVAVRRGPLEQLADQGDPRARRAVGVLKQLSFMLSGAQLGITVTSLIVGFIAEPTIGRALAPLFRYVGMSESVAFGVAVTIAFVLATTAQMIFGELAPKNMAIAEPHAFALGLARGTALYTRLAAPLIWLFDSASNGLLRAVGIEPVDELNGGVSPDELEYIIDDASRGGALDDATAGLLRRSLDFRSLRADDAMVSRNHVHHIAADATGDDLRTLALATGHSRFPVTTGELDHVLGLVQVKDLLRLPVAQRDTAVVRSLLKPVLAVPESTRLAPLLGDMRESHSQLAVVVDEFGGTAGIVTLEDIVEELVGDIEDEYDAVEPGVERLAGGSFLVPGALRIQEAIRETGMELPEGDYDTVGGLIMAMLGRIPQTGDSVEVEGTTLSVTEMDGMAVQAVRVIPGEPGA